MSKETIVLGATQLRILCQTQEVIVGRSKVVLEINSSNDDEFEIEKTVAALSAFIDPDDEEDEDSLDVDDDDDLEEDEENPFSDDTDIEPVDDEDFDDDDIEPGDEDKEPIVKPKKLSVHKRPM